MRSLRQTVGMSAVMSSPTINPNDRELCWQGSLFGDGAPSFDATFADVRRHLLDQTSWIDHGSNWLMGADQVCEQLLHALPWRQREVRMWERVLPEPRLTHWWDGSDGTPEAIPVLGDIRLALSEHYRRHFDTIGYNLYRDGHDSVAWHGDRERFTHENPVVVIVSTGAPRRFLVRPRGGGASHRFTVGHGDLLVMGGACQHDWEHCVPKSARAAGPRVSIMFRHNLANGAPKA